MGFSKYYLDDGSIYEGDFQENERRGFRRLFKPNGNYCFGEFANDSFSGISKLREYMTSGDLYEGFVSNNLKEKEGIYHFQNSEIYYGQFKNGQFQGIGKMISVNSDFVIWKYETGKLIKELRRRKISKWI